MPIRLLPMPANLPAPDASLDALLALAGRDTPVRTASQAKTGWAGLVRDVARSGAAIVTHHNRPEVVLLDPAAYADLLRRAQERDPLAVLTADFDRRLAALHTPAGGAALKRVAAAGIGPRTRRARKTATR